ncbi:polysaccharide biosynthesis tyrosine autokinase [Demequina sp. B12]|uniref:polysaccharide biosynthesis tyrosine autokinase n=1 Tax=Demequina sp. B12 TaxID=2992757 RepID=UPI00237B096A|nr:polysaccharide biosynthesis tyrosine autokinase [Demequina sp. B12]MDE0573657.1 polysaccharide biosynthesis tyrosine autokinase [Demequina sp. B12]
MELSDFGKVFRAYWVAIVLATLLGGALAYGYTLTQPKVYTANASAIITTGVSEDINQALIGDNYAKSRVQSYLDIGQSRAVAEYVIDDLGLTSSSDSLVGRVSVSNPDDSAVLQVSATGASPEEAQELAESWVAGMSQAVAMLENGVTDPADLPANDASVVRLQTLDSATLPGSPSSPNVRFAVALGLVLGFAAGVTYALIRAALDRRLRTPESVTKEFTLPVLGAVPFDADIAKNGIVKASPDFATEESIRELRTNLQFMDVDNPPRLIVVTSPLPGDGKSTITIKLAQAISESGQKVIIVDGDLRRSRVVDYLGLVKGAGLTDVLVGRATLDDVLQPYGTSGDLWVLGSGSTPPNPSELLGSTLMQDTLRSLDSSAIILIDAPPLIPVTDAAILTARTDGALVVARAGKTTVDILDRSLQSIDKVKGRALGVILTGMSRKGPDSHYYGYSYEYADAGKPGRPRVKRSKAPGAGR